MFIEFSDCFLNLDNVSFFAKEDGDGQYYIKAFINEKTAMPLVEYSTSKKDRDKRWDELKIIIRVNDMLIKDCNTSVISGFLESIKKLKEENDKCGH